MGKGRSRRLRVKRALDATQGNLHRIALGKALPTILPEAPKLKDVTKLPKSLRRMMSLQEAAQAEQAGPRPSKQQKGSTAEEAMRQGAGDAGGNGADGPPSTSGRVSGGDGSSGAGRSGRGNAPAGAPINPVKQVLANPFEQFNVKKLKASKKEYLKAKAARSKQRRKGPLVVEKELELAAKDRVQFGERVDAPLQVQLKRKHWAGQQEQRQKTAGERCKEVFLKRVREASARMDGSVEAEFGVAAQKRARMQQPQVDADKEAIRLQVIDAYRKQKKQSQGVGQATSASLAKLVKGGGANTNLAIR